MTLLLRRTIWNSSMWMWMGCCQPPELFRKIQRSAVFRCTLKRNRVQSTNCWLICHCPLPRSNRKFRVMRIRSSWAAALSAGRGGIQMGKNVQGCPAARALAIIWVGDKLPSGAGVSPWIRNSTK